MEERTKGDIAIYRDHPDAETAKSLIYIRAVDREYLSSDVAMVFGAPAGSEQEANAEFLVKAWGAHDQLVAENAALRADLSDARSNWIDAAEELRHADLMREQLVAALTGLMAVQSVATQCPQSPEMLADTRTLFQVARAALTAAGAP
jgi:hypothetical protein